LYEKYKDQGLQVVLASQLWGNFKKDTTALTAAQELELSKRYWVEEHKLTMPIGVDTTRLVANPRDPKGRMMREQDPISKAFNVFGYPTFVLIDRKGIVRALREPNEEVIKKLLTEAADLKG
jgi:hypothetical protein